MKNSPEGADYPQSTQEKTLEDTFPERGGKASAPTNAEPAGTFAVKIQVKFLGL